MNTFGTLLWCQIVYFIKSLTAALLVIWIIFLVPVCISLPVIDGDGPSSSTQTLTDAMVSKHSKLATFGYGWF